MSSIDAMQKWYVLQVLSNREKKVQKALLENRSAQNMEELLSEVLLPSEKVAEFKKGEQKVTEKRLWPGYLLVKVDLSDEAWSYIKNTNGVIGFLGNAPPAPLTQHEVDEILSDLQAKKEEIVHKHDIDIGDRVKINAGVFVNFIGQVVEVSHEKGKLSVMVNIFGRETRVEDLEFLQVERVDQDAEELI